MSRLLALSLLAACVPEEPREAPQWTDQPTERVLLWQGFAQQWSYNHRLNSLGDYVGPVRCEGPDCRSTLVHSAASGSGADTAVYASRATEVAAMGVQFLQGSFVFDVQEAAGEGLLVSQLVDETLVLPEVLQGRDQYHLLLNGFDVFATEDADKLAHLTIDLERPQVSGSTAEIAARLDLVLDCDSLECDGIADKLDRDVAYRVEVPWLLVVADDADLALTESSFASDYRWDDGTGEELQLEDVRRDIRVNGEPGWGLGVLAFSGLSVDLDRDHHMAAWASQVRDVQYDPSSGQVDATLEMMFKQWNQGTLDFVLAYSDAGAASTEARLALLQMDAGCSGEREEQGEIHWAADGSPATSAAAVRQAPITLGEHTLRCY